MTEDIQRKFQTEMENFNKAHKEMMKFISTKQKLNAQLIENLVVKDELNILPEDSKVYKSVGPVLIKTELVEAKQNVNKRVEYLKKEMDRVEEIIGNLDKKTNALEESLQKLQHQFQQAHVKAAMQA